jgi:cytochrome P450
MTNLAIPKLPALPILGNMADFRARRLDLLQRVQRECGDVGIFQVGVWPVVLLNAPDDIATVLVEQPDAFQKSPLFRRYLRSWFGNGLFVREGEKHRQRRRLMAPAFQHRRVAQYAPTITNYAEHMQRQWTDGMEIDLADAMMRLTLWIAGSTLSHIDLLDAADEISAAITELADLVGEVAHRLVPVPMHWPTPRNRRLQATIERIDATIYRIIAEHRRQDQDHGDILSMLLQVRDEDNGAGLTDHEVRDELVTLLIAGHETLTAALAWTWYLLMQHPHVYQQVRNEVDRAVAGRTTTAGDLAQLPYTLQVLKESLRLYPPAWIIMRQARQPVDLDHYRLPKGMRVAISPYTLHRNPAYFSDPERFDPGRWTPEREAKLPRYAYLPFGAGPHTCIGNHFAMMEAQLILATLVQHVSFELVPGQTIEPEPLITLRPKRGLRVIVRRQER